MVSVSQLFFVSVLSSSLAPNDGVGERRSQIGCRGVMGVGVVGVMGVGVVGVVVSGGAFLFLCVVWCIPSAGGAFLFLGVVWCIPSAAFFVFALSAVDAAVDADALDAAADADALDESVI